MSATILWILAVVLVVVGIVQLLQGQILLGIVLLIAAALVGPGGYSIFHGTTRVNVCRPAATVKVCGRPGGPGVA